MSDQWTPPPNGAPCWINLFATDVLRARKFWETAMGWKFRQSTTRMDGTEEDPGEIAHIDPMPNFPGGGITKVTEVIQTQGKGGAVLYLYTDDMKEAEKKILHAGGKKVTELEPEGKDAVMQNFEDTEGNYFGIYSMQKS